jgi:G:T/U-mismatch repair DNA glycosylase
MRQLSENSTLKQWLECSIIYIVLPSTSPANARLSAEEKLKQWKEALYNI